MFFQANDGTHGAELWQSNGTAAGTRMVADINPNDAGQNPGSYPYHFVNVNGTLFFQATDGSTGVEPWVLGPLPPPPAGGNAIVAPRRPPAASLNPSPPFRGRGAGVRG